MGVIRTLNSRGGIQWIRDRLGKLDPRQALCQAISLELSVGHDDLTRGGTWFLSGKAWDMLKNLKGSINGSNNSRSPC